MENLGIAKGIAITNDVAEIIEVKTKTNVGSGIITITGELTDSILISVKNSLNFLKTFIDIATTDINILIEGNKYPITGSSLGLCIYSSIISALENKPIDKNIVFTGEITEEGKILKVGGMDLKKACAEKHNLKLCTKI